MASEGLSLFESEEGFFNPWKNVVYPCSWADERQHDPIFHKHALGRLRTVFEVLKTAIVVATDLKAAAKSISIFFLTLLILCSDSKTQHLIIGEFNVTIPPGYTIMPAPNMTHGTVFFRSTFNEDMCICNVTLQPQFPNCGKLMDEARAVAAKVNGSLSRISSLNGSL